MKSMVPVIIRFLVCWLFLASTALAQIEIVRGDYFPADQEFKELRKVTADHKVGVGGPLVQAAGREIIEEAGFQSYAQRRYETVDGGNLSIEVVSAKDEKAAYSLLTLLRPGAIRRGPPGGQFSSDSRQLTFSSGNYWVRILGDSPADLQHRVALSVGNRIGTRSLSTPALISHLPSAGLRPDSERYFLGPKSFAAFAGKGVGAPLDLRPEMEVVRAEYSLRNQSGVLLLLNFPTGQIAADYFENLAENFKPIAGEGFRVYSRKVGPMIGILEGNFDATIADEILADLKFSYSIKWIYDKNSRSQPTVWGVPVRILGTVVRSLVFTVLLCCLSLLLGIAIAAFRFFLRGYAPGNILDRPERTEMIRLRLSDPPPVSSAAVKKVENAK